MTPLPSVLGGVDLVAWRLDRHPYARTWNSGVGASKVGGRWNSKGIDAVYCSLDPSTAILEIAAHVGFDFINRNKYVLTSFKIISTSSVFVVDPSAIPNPHWLHPCAHSKGQQEYGDNLLNSYEFIVIPSAISPKSWNLIFSSSKAKGSYVMVEQERFALDPRLSP